MQAAALDISNRYRSPRNPERKVRSSTSLIILHTTEAPARSSLNKVSDRGECHFCVTEEGTIYAIVDRDKEAFHAGRSMWAGKEDVDKFSVGIECVGYHDKPMPMVQLRAIAALVKDLQKMYKLPDQAVIAHSHVAYGAPNKWQKRNHRGRKRCGMLFATKTIRAILDLKARPRVDQDVKAGRLTVGDPYLEQVLYRNVDTMKNHYPKGAASTKPKSSFATWLSGFDKKDAPKAAAKPAAKPATKSAAKKPAAKSATKKSAAKPAPKPAPKPAAKGPPKSVADLKAQGYVVKGVISPDKTASKIAGAKWNAPDTYYTIRNKIYSGKEVNPSKFEKGMQVWRKK